jgi:thiaminase
MRQALTTYLAELDLAVESFPWHARRAYADWLAQTYYYVRHSTRLLAAAAARFAHDERGTALHQRFAEHMGEEKRHELLALHDMRALGHTLEEFPERDATRMFYETQYYKIEHQDPLTLFGYILQLEAGMARKGNYILEQTDVLYGRAAGTFVRVHAQDDVEHVEKAFAALAGLSDETLQLIERNLRQSATAYLFLLQAIRSDVDREAADRAA